MLHEGPGEYGGTGEEADQGAGEQGVAQDGGGGPAGILAADHDAVVEGLPFTGQGRLPTASSAERQGGDGPARGQRPGDPFARERFDVTCGVADGEEPVGRYSRRLAREIRRAPPRESAKVRRRRKSQAANFICKSANFAVPCSNAPSSL